MLKDAWSGVGEFSSLAPVLSLKTEVGRAGGALCMLPHYLPSTSCTYTSQHHPYCSGCPNAYPPAHKFLFAGWIPCLLPPSFNFQHRSCAIVSLSCPFSNMRATMARSH